MMPQFYVDGVPVDLHLLEDIYAEMFPDAAQEKCYYFHDELQDVRGWEKSDEATFAREHAALVQARSETGITDCTIVTWEDERELDCGINVVPVWKWALEEAIVDKFE